MAASAAAPSRRKGAFDMDRLLDRYATLVGRLLIAPIFFMAGIHKIMDPAGTMKFMADHGMPFVKFFYLGAILCEVGGSISVLTGFKARFGALVLAFFLVPTVLIFHAFWNAPAEMAHLDQLMFLKDIAILGGCLFVAAYGPGPFSLGGGKKMS
jgi:putative oxidoreductase